jgi:hypothetical protein
MLGSFLSLRSILPAAILMALLVGDMGVLRAVVSDNVESAGVSNPEDPEIDRSPIWAMVYGKYLTFLGREMFWPDIARQDRFRIAVVNWPDLAEDLSNRLDGRAIAGMPVEIVALSTKNLAGEKGDFTLLFVGGSIGPQTRDDLSAALVRWQRKGDKSALVITDGAPMEGHDVVFKRLKGADGPTLCITPAFQSLRSKSLELPPHFLKRPCP